MNRLSESILTAADALPEGSLLSANAFLHLASRAAVNQALTRLTQKGKLRRILLPSHKLGKAIAYTHKLWARLERYVEREKGLAHLGHASRCARQCADLLAG